MFPRRTAVLSLSLSALTLCAGCSSSNNAVTLTIVPASPTVAAGQKLTVEAMLVDAAGNRSALPGEAVTWSSSDSSIATVAAKGSGADVTGVKLGTATLTAAAKGIKTTATVEVTAPVLTAIALTPPLPAAAAGTQVQLIATGVYSDGTTAELTDTATWTCEPTSAATVATTRPFGAHST